mmetsp:Transcript_13987/g.11258  ORF Transcript_13987/g.11258 Transcript_13987/m.11258 type:complete len:92 (-) Transcript_13987:209-484(-)
MTHTSLLCSCRSRLPIAMFLMSKPKTYLGLWSQFIAFCALLDDDTRRALQNGLSQCSLSQNGYGPPLRNGMTVFFFFFFFSSKASKTLKHA